MGIERLWTCMNKTRFTPTAFTVAALIVGSACSASTTDSSGTITTSELAGETVPPTSLSVPLPAPTAPVVTNASPPEPPTDQPSTTAPPPTTTSPMTASATTTLLPTTSPPTTLPPTTLPPATPPSADPAPISAVDVPGQSVFGIGIFNAVDVESAARDVSAQLGSPTSDSGWQSMEGQVDCTGSTDFRVLWWGDFRMTFERYQGDGIVRDELSAWTVGDPTLSGLVPIGEVPATSPSNVVTIGGIGLESTRADLEAEWANIYDSDGDGRLVVIDRGSLQITLDDDDQVVGFGDGPFDCPTDEQR